jgi:hypothetical protein
VFISVLDSWLLAISQRLLLRRTPKRCVQPEAEIEEDPEEVQPEHYYKTKIM